MTGLQTGQTRDHGLISGMGKDFSFFQNVQTSSVAHSVHWAAHVIYPGVK